MATDGDYLPPPLPPPLLGEGELAHLMEHGHVALRLPPQLAALYQHLDARTETFFREDEAVKQRAYPAAQVTELGYYVVEGEKEYVTLRSSTVEPGAGGDTADKARLDSLRAGLEEPAARLWQQTAALMYRVLIQVSRALDIPASAWDALLDGCMGLPEDREHATPSLLRLFRYEPDQGVAGKHVDNGLLTLCVGAERGLQVWQRQAGADSTAPPDAPGEWHDAQGPTLLLGTTLRVLCSSRVAAGSHRVVANPRGRRSIVFALRPSTRHVLELAPFGGTGSWDVDVLWKRITSQRVNVNAKHELRLEQALKRGSRLDKGQRQQQQESTTMGMA